MSSEVHDFSGDMVVAGSIHNGSREYAELELRFCLQDSA